MGSKRNKEARVRGGAAAHLDPVLADHDVALERIQGGRCALPGLHLCTVECFAPTGSKHMRQGLWGQGAGGRRLTAHGASRMDLNELDHIRLVRLG